MPQRERGRSAGAFPMANCHGMSRTARSAALPWPDTASALEFGVGELVISLPQPEFPDGLPGNGRPEHAFSRHLPAGSALSGQAQGIINERHVACLGCQFGVRRQRDHREHLCIAGDFLRAAAPASRAEAGLGRPGGTGCPDPVAPQAAAAGPAGNARHADGWHRRLGRGRWTYPRLGGRPPVDAKLAMLIEQMAGENPGHRPRRRAGYPPRAALPCPRRHHRPDRRPGCRADTTSQGPRRPHPRA
jgi:hypothetical protein